MIGGEHRKERFSERLEGAQNQPKNRGYLPGCELKTGGYSTNTLTGNWYEEQADAAYSDGQAVLPTENARLWTTSYREMVKPVAAAALASGAQAPQLQHSFNQSIMIEVVDRSKSSYPAHQPHLDPRRAETAATALRTVSQMTYVPPTVAAAEEQAFVAPVFGGVPGAQAAGILLRLRRQLELGMPGASAFPGNVLRCVRTALTASVAATAAATPEVNARELQAGLAAVGIHSSPAECRALVRHFDTTGGGTASVATLADRLRGDVTDRRQQIIRSVYRFLVTVAVADRAEGRVVFGGGGGGGGGDGLVRLRRLVELVDVLQLPAVASGETTEEEARAAFEEQWSPPPPDAVGCSYSGGGGGGGFGGTAAMAGRSLYGGASNDGGNSCSGDGMLISEEAFKMFFSDVSFDIATEGEFELTMRNIWHLSGGNGTCENTSCRRLEVVHLNGRVTAEEVKNDLAIRGTSDDDGDAAGVDAAIRANLIKQGIKDIKSYRVL